MIDDMMDGKMGKPWMGRDWGWEFMGWEWC